MKTLNHSKTVVLGEGDDAIRLELAYNEKGELLSVKLGIDEEPWAILDLLRVGEFLRGECFLGPICADHGAYETDAEFYGCPKCGHRRPAKIGGPASIAPAEASR